MLGNEKKLYDELPTYPPKKRYFSDLMDRMFICNQNNYIYMITSRTVYQFL